MKKNKHAIITLIATYLFFLLVFPVLLNFLATSKLDLIFINANNYGDWIGYYGSITGGFMTLAGVGWTLQYQQKFQIEQQKSNTKPIIKISTSVKNDIMKVNNNRFYIAFRLENVGDGEARNIQTKIKYTDSINRLKILERDNPIYYTPYLAKKDNQDYIYDLDIEDTNDKSLKAFSLTYEVTYSGVIGCYKSTLFCNFCDEYLLDENQTSYRNFYYSSGTFKQKEVSEIPKAPIPDD